MDVIGPEGLSVERRLYSAATRPPAFGMPASVAPPSSGRWRLPGVVEGTTYKMATPAKSHAEIDWLLSELHDKSGNPVGDKMSEKRTEF